MAPAPMSLAECEPETLSEIAQACDVSPECIEDVYACTPLQLGMMADSSRRQGAYTYRLILCIKPHIDVHAFLDALGHTVSRNPVLRTRIVDTTAGILQAVVRERHHTRNYSGPLTDYLEDDRSQPMGLGTPLLRAALVEQKLIITIHHAIGDQWANLAFLANVSRVYCNQEPICHAPFKDFVRHCSSIGAEDAEAFWKSRYQSIPSHFPPVKPNYVPEPTNHISKRVEFAPSEANASIALIPSYIETAWALTAGLYTGGQCIAFGMVISGRSPTLDGLESTLGPTLVTVPVQVALHSHQTIKQILQERSKQRRQLQGNTALQYGLARIRAMSPEARASSEFQTLLSIRPTGDQGSGFAEFTVEKSNVVGPYSINITCTLESNGILLEVSSDPRIVEEIQLRRVICQFEHILRWLLRQPLQTTVDRLPTLSPHDRAEIMAWNAHIPRPVAKTLHGLIAERMHQRPDALAVVAGDGDLSYDGLDKYASRLARQLANMGLAPQEPVAFIFEKSRWVIVAILAILKSGGACVPIDPVSPHTRKASLVSMAGARFVLTSEEYSRSCGGLAQHVVTVSSAALEPLTACTNRDLVSPEDPAYIMFTSGTTGQPKGVVLEHRSLASSLMQLAPHFHWGTQTRTLQFAAYVWDASLLEIFGALLFGGCVCIPSLAERESGLAAFANTSKITWALLTPTVLRTISPDEVPNLQTLASGGEPIDAEATEVWSTHSRFFNCYGPAEASIISTLAQLVVDAPYPHTIGRAVGCVTWIADPDDISRLLPIGATGELLVQGPNVARGYHNDEARTSQAFISPPPWLGAQLSETQKAYRTGDLARYNADGSICFVGRRDQQVKLRGQRIELGEVENVLSKSTHVNGAFAELITTDTGHKELAVVVALGAFMSSATQGLHLINSTEFADAAAVKAEIQAFARARLPAHMVPTLWFAVSLLPQATSAKLDRKFISSWLQQQDLGVARLGEQQLSTSLVTPPTNSKEVELQKAWSSVLKTADIRIGRESSFIALGGDSISAMQVATRYRKQGFHITVAILLGSENLAQAAAKSQAIHIAPSEIVQHGIATSRLSPVQHLFFSGDGPASYDHFNHSWALQLRSEISATALETVLGKLVEHHAMLRARIRQKGHSEWRQEVDVMSDDAWSFEYHQSIAPDKVFEIIELRQTTINIEHGPVFAADLIDLEDASRLLLLVAHHIVVDLVSWRIIWEDLETLILNPGTPLASSASFLNWTEQQLSQTYQVQPSHIKPPAYADFWGMSGQCARSGDLVKQSFEVDTKATRLIMGLSNRAYNTTPTEIMLSAVFQAFRTIFPDREDARVYCESHGRPAGAAALDVSRTVGWFTTLSPIVLPSATALPIIASVKDSYRKATRDPLASFSACMASEHPLQRQEIELLFNFAGRLQQIDGERSLLALDHRFSGDVLQVAGEVPQVALISVAAAVKGDNLQFWIEYNGRMAHQDRLQRFVVELQQCLEQLARTLPARQPELTLDDMPLLRARYQDLPQIHKSLLALDVPISNIMTILPCTPMQEGMLLAQSKGHGDPYLGRFIFKFSSKTMVDTTRVSAAWSLLCGAHGVLRTITASGLTLNGAFQQIVLKNFEPAISHLQTGKGDDIVSAMKNCPRPKLLQNCPAHRLTLASSAAGDVFAMIDISHVLTDARTMQLLAVQLQAAYIDPMRIPTSPDFGLHVAHLQSKRQESKTYWSSYLATAQPTLLPYVGHRPESKSEQNISAIGVSFTDHPRLLGFCRGHNLTVANVVQVAWGLALQQLTGSYDVLFGYLFSGRDVSEEAHNTVGPLINMLVCRLKTTPDMSILAAVKRAKKDFAAGFENSACLLIELQDALGFGASPLFDTAMSVQHTWTSQIETENLTDLSMELQHVEDPTEFALTVNVMYTNESFLCKLFYKPALVSDSLAKDLASAYAAILDCVVKDEQRSVAALRTAAPLPVPPPFSLLSPQEVKSCKRQAATQCEVSASLIEDIFPVLPTQQDSIAAAVSGENRLWKQNIYRPTQQVSLDRLCGAWSTAISATPALRTRIVSLANIGTLQVLLKATSVWEEVEDESLRDYLIRDRDYAPRYGGGLTRLSILRESPADQHVVVSYHAAICDHITFQRVEAIVQTILRDEAVQHMAPANGFIRSRLATTDRLRLFWQAMLIGSEEALSYPRATPTSATTTPISRKLSVNIGGKHREIPALLHAAWALCLTRLTGSQKVGFNVVLDGRDGFSSGSGLLSGALTFTVPCIVTVDSGAGSEGLIEQLSQYATKVLPYAHARAQDFELSFTNTIQVTKAHRAAGVCLNALLESVPKLLGHQSQSPPHFAINCTIEEGLVAIDITTSIAAITSERLQLILFQYEHAICQLAFAAEKPDVPLTSFLSVGEHELALLDSFNAQIDTPVDACLHVLVRAVAQQYPRAPAVCSWDRSLDYQQLDVLSNRMATMLQHIGVGPENIVPFCCEKSAVAPVVMLGIIKAGGAMLPLDITHPAARLKNIIQDSGASVVVCSSGLREEVARIAPQSLAIDFSVLEAQPDGVVQDITTPANACYVISSSGSTGKPKSILVEHRNVSSSITSHLQPLGITRHSRVLQIATFAFDAAIAEVFFPLLAGGCICMPSDAERSDNIASAIVRTSANFSFMTPSMARILTPSKVPLLRTLALMGEAMTAEDVDLWKDIRLINAYGPAEGAIISSCGDVVPGAASAFTNIGRPHGCRFYVSSPDDHNTLAAIGSPGELIIHGPSVAREYMHEPEKTAAAFIPVPEWTKVLPSWQKASTDRFYKTGDLVMQNIDGTMIYLGRKGLDIKIRGQRVDLSEVEGHLKLLLGTAPALAVEAVHVHGDDKDLRLVAFVAAQPSESIRSGNGTEADVQLLEPLPRQAATLREGLKEVLAAYMAPDLYIWLHRLPLSPSGKVDRKLLRSVGAKLSQEQLVAYSAFRECSDAETLVSERQSCQSRLTKNELMLQKLWSKVLSIPQQSISITDNFLAVGGNSIKAIQLIAAARDEGFQITVADVFQNTALNELARVMGDAEVAEVQVTPFALLNHFPDFEEARERAALLCGIDHLQVEDMYPATPLQQGLLAMSSKRSGDYVAQIVLPLSAGVDLDAFKAAWQSIAAATPILRTRIVDLPVEGVVQVVVREEVVWTQYIDLDTALAYDFRSEMTLGSSLHRCGIHIDSTTGVRHFVLTIHHALYDGWSMALLLQAVEKMYKGGVMPLTSFQPFIKHILEQDLEHRDAFWTSQFVGLEAPQFPTLPSAGYTPRANATFEHMVHDLWPASLTTTMATVIRAAWALLLGSYTGTSDAVFGTIVTGRHAAVPGIERIAGPTIATVPVRINIDRNQTAQSLLAQVQQQSVEMTTFEQTGLQVIRGISAEAEIACGFQTLLLIQPHSSDTAQVPSTVFEQQDNTKDVAFDSFSTYSIMLVCEQESDRLQLRFAYDTNVVEDAMVRRLASQLEHLLQQLCNEEVLSDKVADLPTTGISDIADIWSWNAQLPEPVEDCVHTLISRTAHSYPHNSAVQAWDGDLTYESLEQLSDTLAGHLVQLGVAHHDVVTLLFPKSMWTPVAALAVWKAGASAVLLDTAHPKERLIEILTQAKPRLMICASSLVALSRSLDPVLTAVPLAWNEVDEMSDTEQITELPTARPSDVLYMVFTSGSTGTPKAAIITHSNFSSALQHQAASIGLTSSSKVLDISAYSFDMAWYSILHTLYSGGCLCIPSDQERKDDISGAVLRYGVDFVNTTPSFANVLNDDALQQLRTVELAGEVASRELFERLRHHGCTPRNRYGPAECTAIVIASDNMDTPSKIGIGSGAVTWLADPLNPARLVPVGCIGEILIEGPLVGAGYLGLPEQTAAAFISSPLWLTDGFKSHPGRHERLYRTGDLARYEADGSLTYLGRKDGQVKIRGQRVELGEVEHHISASLKVAGHHGVRVVAEVGKPRGSVSAQLVAFLVPAEAAHMDETELQQAVLHAGRGLEDQLALLLPRYMVPTAFVAVAELPETPSGKLDRLSLRKLIADTDLNSLSRIAEIFPPSSELEFTMREIWSDVLNIPASSISVQTRFSRLGDSIQAMQIVSKARQKQISISTESLLRLQTIQLLCREHESTKDDDGAPERISPSTVALDVLNQRFVLSPVQQWFFDKQPSNMCFDVPLLLVLHKRSSPRAVRQALDQLVTRHSVLRARFEQDAAQQWSQYIQADVASSYSFEYHAAESEAELASLIQQCRMDLDIETGPMVAARLVEMDDAQVLFLTTHHLVMDYMSWRILIAELDDILSGRNSPAERGPPHSFQQWVIAQAEHTRSNLSPERALPAGFQNQPANLEYWGLDEELILHKRYASLTLTLDAATTAGIVESSQMKATSSTLFELLLSALLYSFSQAFPDRALPPCFAEGHGREPWKGSNTDLSQTVGWFTTIFPIQLQRSRARSLADTTRGVVKAMLSLPNRGFDYMSTRYLHPRGREVFATSEGICELNFNFLGTFYQFEKDDSLFSLTPLPKGSDPESTLDYRPISVFDIGAVVIRGELQVTFKYGCADHFVERLANEYEKVLRFIAAGGA